MHFKYVGDPRHDGDGPKQMTAFGHVFQKDGEPVEVADRKAAAKLEGNPHFEKVDGRSTAAKSAGGKKTAAKSAGEDKPADADEA